MDANHGEIWAKLDAGTEAYHRLINRPSHPLSHVLENIISASVDRDICIQSLFMRVHGQPPDDEEIVAYAGRLNEVKAAGGRIKLVQVYTVARQPTEPFVTPLSDETVDDIADTVERVTGLKTARYYAA
jgi:wyosine [tRNA(Phe)-imidazoG37] synthetase (radical SAM superfamily)